jgi:hypothetical protein
MVTSITSHLRRWHLAAVTIGTEWLGQTKLNALMIIFHIGLKGVTDNMLTIG